jgi:hypothetical protein
VVEVRHLDTVEIVVTEREPHRVLRAPVGIRLVEVGGLLAVEHDQSVRVVFEIVRGQPQLVSITEQPGERRDRDVAVVASK